jgi:hypothetical protein
MHILQKLPPSDRVLTPQDFLIGSYNNFNATFGEIKKKYQTVLPEIVTAWQEWVTSPLRENFKNDNDYVSAREDHKRFLSGLTVPTTDNVHDHISWYVSIFFCFVIFHVFSFVFFNFN